MNHRPARRPLCAAALIACALAPCAGAHAQSATLPEVTVTARRLPDTSQALPMGVSVITADDIRASGATTVNEALVRLLGVAGRADLYNAGDTSLDLRGFGATADSNQVVVLDGQRLSEADTSGARLASIPIDAVERIEVLRGSGAVLYGEGATGGVILITTKAGAGLQRRTGGSAYAAAGNQGLREGRANLTLAHQGLSTDLHVERRMSDGWRANSASDFSGQSLGAQWSGDWLRLGGEVAGEGLNARLPGALSRSQYQADPRQASTPNDWARIDGARHRLFAQAEAGAWEFTGEVGHRSRTLRTASGYDYDIAADTGNLRARSDRAVFGLPNVLVLGHDHEQWRREVLGAFGASASQDSGAWYVRDDLSLPGGTRIAAGLRSERIAKTDTAATANLRDRLRAWELGLSQSLPAGVTAYGRVARSFRLAKVDEFSFTSPGGLAPQTSRDLELGARWQHAQGSVDARLYRSDLDKEIGFDPNAIGPSSPFGFNGANVNLDPTRRQGLELDASRRLAPTLSLALHGALRSAEFRSGPYQGRQVPLVPRRTLSVRADWVPLPKHHVGGGVNWVSSQFVDFGNTCSVPGYTTVDLRYAYQWGPAELSLAASNLFDRRFFTQAFGCSGGQATSIYPEPGRLITAALRLAF